MREWEHLRTEFESFPEFVSLVSSVHRMPTHIGSLGTYVKQDYKIGSVSQYQMTGYCLTPIVRLRISELGELLARPVALVNRR